jgi:hypothetical protein
MVKYPIVSLGAEDGTAGGLVLLSVRGYLILWKICHSDIAWLTIHSLNQSYDKPTECRNDSDERQH